VASWNTTYPTHPWVDDDTVHHRWTERKPGNATTLRSGLVKRMGLLALEGTWVDVVVGGTPITVTLLAGTGYIDAGVYTDELRAVISKGAMQGPYRLVERSAADGSNLVVARAAQGRVVFDKTRKQFRSFQPPAPSGPDQHGMVLQVADGVVRPLIRANNMAERMLLVEHGLESFDVLLTYSLLMDTGHKLLGERTDFLEIRAALDALKYDRNTLVAHSNGRVSSAEFDRAIANIHTFLEACVDKHALFDAEWKQHLEDAVANACNATWTVSDTNLDLGPEDLDGLLSTNVDRRHGEPKRLSPEQVCS
jgi:hypothetical protein